MTAWHPEAKKKILLVDNEEDTHEPFKIRLEEEGYQVFTANSGVDAYEVIRNERPNLMVLDLHMPEGMHGHELLEKMRDEEIWPRPKVVIWTGVTNPNVKQVIEAEFSVAAYLEKPLVVKDFIRLVKEILGDN